ncbi:phosphopantetheine-binding protein [Actinacidiphila oryziradicis]|uniref:Acyl carrier protein n=1 Tax=Actinacidiphila oryziradicis TaxID=2571141 RepID=A0A4U0RXE1_9ACTN|nr:acyl carrier protein [Actinacidiphila oryziradicis]TKA00303.1 acyl carrier protein [Actinacidiphila oryziradicis]
MSTETEFVSDALRFLEEIGADISGVEPGTHLFDSGVLDSLGTLAFLDFLEQQMGEEIEIDALDMDSIATLRGAHRFVQDQKQD